MIGRGQKSNRIAHFALDFLRKESVCVRASSSIEPEGSLLAPASADGPPRGLGGVGALCVGPFEELAHVEARTRACQQDAMFIQGPRKTGS
jgi:hypothetical protein